MGGISAAPCIKTTNLSAIIGYFGNVKEPYKENFSNWRKSRKTTEVNAGILTTLRYPIQGVLNNRGNLKYAEQMGDLNKRRAG